MSITVRDLSFSYEADRPVLTHVNFEIKEGTLVCLLGSNGAGKSTLFKNILRLLPGYTGTVMLDGRDTSELSVREMARLAAYIPQSHEPTFNYSVSDMVLMGTTAGLPALGVPGARQRRLAEEMMERMGIGHLSGRGFAQISGGERQLTLIARALAQETKVLLMDEPTANLDYGNQVLVLEQIRKLAESGYTILEATHQPDQAFLFADEVLAIKDGTVLTQGKAKDVIDEAFIRELYGVEVRVEAVADDRMRVCVPLAALRQRQLTETGKEIG
ncbi:MAG TPA: ABC transporter [Lachnospiraceae bacterium]|nr:ABC transporter [Lachnospiraceae bacterium]